MGYNGLLNGPSPTFAWLVSMVLLLNGCATDSQRTRTEGAVAGGAVGAAAGAALGRNANGALIGGLIGSIAGLAVGSAVDQKKEKYRRREAALQASANRAQQLAQQTRVRNAQLSTDIARLDQDVKSLRAQELTAQKRQAMIETDQRRVQILQSGIDLQLVQVRGEIARQQAVLVAEDQQARQTQQQSPADGVHMVQASIRELQSNQRELEEAKAQLQLIDPRREYSR